MRRGLIPLDDVRGSIGQILIQQGVIDASALSDALARQSGRHPVASELYTLGYASERQLCTALSAADRLAGDRARRVGDPARRARARLARVGADLLGARRLRGRARRSWSRRRGPRMRSCRRASSAAARGKNVELRIALDITLARTIRVAFRQVEARRAATSSAARSIARARTSRSCSPTATTTSTAAPSARSPRRPRATSSRRRAAVRGVPIGATA